jgi:hypothetical protein
VAILDFRSVSPTETWHHCREEAVNEEQTMQWQKKKDKKTNNGLQNTTQKTKNT